MNKEEARNECIRILGVITKIHETINLKAVALMNEDYEQASIAREEELELQKQVPTLDVVQNVLKIATQT